MADYQRLHCCEHFSILRYSAILQDCCEIGKYADRIKGNGEIVRRQILFKTRRTVHT
jgi:hypothetical protein